MNRAALYAWRSLTDDGSVRALKYTFGPGTANTLAVRLEDGTWLVVSPAAGGPSSVLEDLAKDGTVSALVAPNAYHHMGQGAWRLRFPGAVSYAPEGALSRLASASPSIAYRPTTELTERLGSRVGLLTPEGQKAPDMLVRTSTGAEVVWWMGDLFSNSTAEDQVWWLRRIAPLFGSGLGYRRNGKPGVVYVRDPGAWLRSIRDALERHPPTIVVPAHGDPVLDDTTNRTRDLLNAPNLKTT